MFTCPACQKTHEETKFYCDECHEHHCSLDCLKYKDFPEYDECRAQELSDLTFSCCGRCYCTKCHSWMMYADTDEIILWCEKCERFFHEDCQCDIDNGNDSCMCRLCIDLKKDWKKVICPACHKEHNVKQFSFVNLHDVKQYIDSRISFDFSNCKKFKKFREALYQDYATSISFYVKSKDDSDSDDQLVINELSDHEKSKNWKEIFETFIRNCMDCVNMECDCELCKNVKCNTLLFRLLFSDKKLNDDSDAWDYGNDFAPVKVLKSIAERSDNNCNCDICKFWKAYN